MTETALFGSGRTGEAGPNPGTYHRDTAGSHTRIIGLLEYTYLCSQSLILDPRMSQNEFLY